LLLTVWLRRQEMEVNKVRTLYLAMAEGTVATNGEVKSSSEAYKAFVDSAFPFAAKSRAHTDKQMVEVMKKETQKGPIQFSPVVTSNPLAKAVKTMQVPDDFKKKLQDRIQRARTRR